MIKTIKATAELIEKWDKILGDLHSLFPDRYRWSEDDKPVPAQMLDEFARLYEIETTYMDVKPVDAVQGLYELHPRPLIQSQNAPTKQTEQIH